MKVKTKSPVQNSGTGRLAITTTAVATTTVIHSMQRSLWAMLLLLHLLWMPAANAATYSGGSGTAGDPYLISMDQDFPGLANPVNPQVESLPPTREIQYNGTTSRQGDDDADGF